MDVVDFATGGQMRGDAFLIGGIGFKGLWAREQQGEVHADAGAHEFGQGFDACVGGRYFNHHIGAVDGLMQAFGFGDGAGGIFGQIGRHFQAHEAGFAAAGLVFRQAYVARGLYVGNRQCLVTLFGT